MRSQSSHPRRTRRNILQLAGIATGAAIVAPVLHNLKISGFSPASVIHTLKTSKSILEAANAKNSQAMKIVASPKPTGISKVVLVHTEDRVSGTQQALDLLQPDGIEGKSIFLKPNYNTADPSPAATDTKLLAALVEKLQKAGVGKITVGDRSGMAQTREAMKLKGVFQLAERYGLEAMVFDEMSTEQWQYFSPSGTHWQQGFAFARPILQAGAVVNTCCLKTHRGAHYTLSLKNTVGMVAKYVPGDPFNYMNDLHTSPYMQQMIAEINAVYQPSLVLMDGVETFVEGGPESGKKVAANVILASTDRIAIDVIGLGMLRLLGSTNEVTQGSIWKLAQISTAVELGVGVSHPDQIQLITADRASQRIADQIRRYIT
ncbi:DUF362 domain-containing protein [Anabaena sp. UHCC 0204]|uniref:DUF362 domain-containing protein n=1 Tax=Anabaena sp. UHCC 0204 TaxID=2590009 RepID=UPI00144590DD|nr:DUF362 domain-containing protein [Anabaena sp. UHCC 0204]MTJ07340.1 DUF362 domain-containing protein [Anabaena sp. UHCC 0204]